MEWNGDVCHSTTESLVGDVMWSAGTEARPAVDSTVHHSTAHRVEMGRMRAAVEWNGMEYSGMEWNGMEDGMERNGMSRWDEAATPKEQPRRSMAPHAVIWEGCHAGCPSRFFSAVLNSVKRTCTLDMDTERLLELDGLKQMRSARFNTACASCGQQAVI